MNCHLNGDTGRKVRLKIKLTTYLGDFLVLQHSHGTLQMGPSLILFTTQDGSGARCLHRDCPETASHVHICSVSLSPAQQKKI